MEGQNEALAARRAVIQDFYTQEDDPRRVEFNRVAENGRGLEYNSFDETNDADVVINESK